MKLTPAEALSCGESGGTNSSALGPRHCRMGSTMGFLGPRVALCERCCACFHDFPRTLQRWQREGLQDAHVHHNFCSALRKRAWVEGLQLRSTGKGGGGGQSRRRGAKSRRKSQATDEPPVDLTQD